MLRENTMNTNNTFNDPRTAIVLSILTYLACLKRTMTYGEIVQFANDRILEDSSDDKMDLFPEEGRAMGNQIGQCLYEILEFCLKRNLPLISGLAVRKSGKNKDLPGNGFWKYVIENKIRKVNVDSYDQKSRTFNSIKKSIYNYYDPTLAYIG